MRCVINTLKLAIILAALSVVAACSGTGMQTAQMEDPESRLYQIQQREAALASQQSELANRESQLAQQQQRIDLQLREARAAESRALAAKPSAAPAAAMDQSLLPPKASGGQCFARVFVPPTYETATQEMLKQEAGERIEIIPAKYTMVDEKVLVKPATSRMVEVPARYAKTSEKVLVKPAHQVWKKGTGPIQRVDQATGEIMCLVDVPAEYRTVTKTVLQSPATTKLIEEPAEYKTIRVTKLVSPAEERKVQIPATYQTVSKQVQTSDGHMEWREILCETNMTHDRISDIQRALQAKGFNPGPIDGVIGSQTISAVNSFQKASKLPVDRYLNVATINALGLTAR